MEVQTVISSRRSVEKSHAVLIQWKLGPLFQSYSVSRSLSVKELSPVICGTLLVPRTTRGHNKTDLLNNIQVLQESGVMM